MGKHKTDLLHVFGTIGSHIEHDVGSVLSGVKDVSKTAITSYAGVQNNLISTAGKTVQGVSSSLSMPLVLVGGAVLFIFITSRK